MLQKWVDDGKRIAAVFVLVVPRLSSLFGYPIAGPDLQLLVDGISATIAAAFVIWSKATKP